jgi:glutamine cyclotransferase
MKGLFSAVLAFLCTALLPILGYAQPPGCPAPRPLSYRVLESRGRISRARGYYTQGLLYHQGSLYESTGLYGRSGLYKIDPRTGRYDRLYRLPKQYFGEGLALLNKELFQLTWKEETIFVYELDSKRPQRSLTYSREGWGLTTDGQNLISSDGSSRLQFLDPQDLSVRRTLEVRRGYTPLEQLNELEYAQGAIWANVYYSNEMVHINPQTGCVEGVVDFSRLLSDRERSRLKNGEVLNGIAYDPQEELFYITGKNWPAIFKIKIKN